jgi:hypothetical protein
MSTGDTNDPEHWRERATQMRALAVKMVDTEAAILMRDLAADYEKVAGRAEIRNDGKSPRSNGKLRWGYRFRATPFDWWLVVTWAYWKSKASIGMLPDMRRLIAIAVTAAVLFLVLTSNSQYDPINRTHCIVDELAAAGFFDPWPARAFDSESEPFCTLYPGNKAYCIGIVFRYISDSE